MSSDVKREYYLFTDDAQEAYREMVDLKFKSAKTEEVGFAEVRFMINPPTTHKKFAVFKIRH